MNDKHPSVPAANRFSRQLKWLSAMGLCGVYSCATLLGTPPVAESADRPVTVRGQSSTGAGRARLPDAPPAAASSSAVPGTRPRMTRPAVRPAPRIQQTAGQRLASDSAIERVSAEARTPALCPDVFAPGFAVDDGPSPQNYPDEYLFDGGDRGYPITRNLDELRGLETEDTIAQFEDHEGRRKIKKTNRVAIYAPRFGSVVAIHGPNADTLVDKVHGHVASQGGINLRNRTVAGTKQLHQGTGRMDTRLRANGVGTEIASNQLSRDQGRGVSVAVMNTHQSLGRVGRDQYDSRLPSTMVEGMALAEIWTRKENPVIEGHATSASQGVKVQAQASFTGLEDHGKRGDLRLHKVADKGVAAIGDVVTFTIHYENAGDKPLKNVVVIDNLTPRLEYIADSASTDRPGRVESENNGEGSVILRFILDEPLPGRTKGSITFQARVR